MINPTTLKNAAFAIEHDLFTDPDGGHYLVKDGAIVRRWEPEHSSADSFELMVALGLDVLNDSMSVTVKKFDGYNQRVLSMHTEYDGNPKQRAMRAILLCAAQIGEKTI